jgi:hypothetical protein
MMSIATPPAAVSSAVTSLAILPAPDTRLLASVAPPPAASLPAAHTPRQPRRPRLHWVHTSEGLRMRWT